MDVTLPVAIAIAVIVGLLAIWIGVELYAVLKNESAKIDTIVEEEAPRPDLNTEGKSDE